MQDNKQYFSLERYPINITGIGHLFNKSDFIKKMIVFLTDCLN